MKHPILLAILITAPIMVGAVVYDQRDRIFPADPGPLIRPAAEVLDDSWNLEKLGGTVTAPKAAQPPAGPQPSRVSPPPDQPPIPIEPVLYYGKTCPHCENVLRFVQDNQIAEKTGLREKEVYQNQDNSKEAVRAATSCGVPEAKMAVPFLFVDGQCLFGDSEVIARLTDMAGDR